MRPYSSQRRSQDGLHVGLHHPFDAAQLGVVLHLVELHSSATAVEVQRFDTHVNSDLVAVLEAVTESSLRGVDANIDAVHVNRCYAILESGFGIPEQTEWRIAKGRSLIVRSDSQIDGVWNLCRQPVEGECRDEANDTLWNFEGNRYEVWVVERLSIGNPVKAAIQSLQKLV